MKLIKDVLVKLVRGGYTDLVLILDNVPEEMFYEMKHPVVPSGNGKHKFYVADTSKPKEPTLYEELTPSQTGDKGIVFDLDNEQALARWREIHRYIQSVWPINQRVVDPVPNTTDVTDPRAGALPKDMIPRAVLPVLSPATATPSPVAATVETAPAVDLEAIKNAAKAEAVAEYQAQLKKEADERMAKARAAKQQ